MEVANARAKVVFEDNQVMLRDLSGDAFSGSVRGGADLTVGSHAIRIDSKLEAIGCEVSQLPAAWGSAKSQR